MEITNGYVLDKFNMSISQELPFNTKPANAVVPKVVNSYKETVLIATTVGIIGIILLATFYGVYYFIKRKRQMVMVVSSVSVPISDYFTRPREPVLLLHELSGQKFNQEPVSYWQRPLKPVTTDTDLYTFVIW